jgi:antitoxin MazE
MLVKVVMGTAIRTRIVKIGNSQGIRLPKLLLEQSGLSSEVEVEVQGDCLVIRAISHPRIGWDEAFKSMADHGDDALLDNGKISDWEDAEWEW